MVVGDDELDAVEAALAQSARRICGRSNMRPRRGRVRQPHRPAPIPRSTSTSWLRASIMRSRSPPTVSYKSGLATCSRDQSTAERGAPFLCELHPSSRNLDEAASAVAKVECVRANLPARRLHRHQHCEAGRQYRRLLQQARDLRAVDQEGQESDPMDSALVPLCSS
jgi:hypothetical protein